ncbi:MAG: phosphoribosyltransferase family protein [Acidimicrobiales bacterium]
MIGNVAGKRCILLDDMIDTAGTIVAAADLLKREGAISVGDGHPRGAVEIRPPSGWRTATPRRS